MRLAALLLILAAAPASAQGIRPRAPAPTVNVPDAGVYYPTSWDHDGQDVEAHSFKSTAIYTEDSFIVPADTFITFLNGTTQVCRIYYSLATARLESNCITKVLALEAQYVQITDGSLDTCNAGAKGRLRVQTSDSALYYCNGTAWKAVQVAP